MDVVLVHGLAGSSRWWRQVEPVLAARHELHVLDLPRRRAEEWLAGRLAALERPVVVGHSLGAHYALRVAARSPVAALALVAPAGVPQGRSPFRLVLPLLSALRIAGPRFAPLVGADAVRAGPLSLLLGARLALGRGPEAELDSLDVPVLLVWGGRDPVVPPGLALRWQEALPAARLVTLPDAGHVPMVERPDELAAALLDFLEEVEREPR